MRVAGPAPKAQSTVIEMRRREAIAILGGGVVGWSLAARAQQKAMQVIGFLGGTSPGPFAPFLAAFHQGLNETGYVEGKNVAIEYRWAEGRYDQLPALAADLVGRKVDMIATTGSIAEALAAKNATSTIPIVFASGVDPVEYGVVASFARPGGNLTGVSFLTVELMPKRLELITELVPRAKMIGLVVNPSNPNAERVMQTVLEAARAKGLQLEIQKADTITEIDTAYAALVRQHADALIIAADLFFGSRREQFAALASRYAMPAIYPVREYVTAGGLISYGTSLTETHRQLGLYSGKILAGAKPADLPVQQPTKFELVINLQTAKTLDFTLPQSMLMRADEVIE
jgi:putative ABC transport system substrate-binding protein